MYGASSQSLPEAETGSPGSDVSLSFHLRLSPLLFTRVFLHMRFALLQQGWSIAHGPNTRASTAFHTGCPLDESLSIRIINGAATVKSLCCVDLIFERNFL